MHVTALWAWLYMYVVYLYMYYCVHVYCVHVGQVCCQLLLTYPDYAAGMPLDYCVVTLHLGPQLCTIHSTLFVLLVLMSLDVYG